MNTRTHTYTHGTGSHTFLCVRWLLGFLLLHQISSSYTESVSFISAQSQAACRGLAGTVFCSKGQWLDFSVIHSAQTLTRFTYWPQWECMCVVCVHVTEWLGPWCFMFIVQFYIDPAVCRLLLYAPTHYTDAIVICWSEILCVGSYWSHLSSF